MVDKILEFSLIKHSKEEIEAFQNKIINMKDARYIFLFSKYVNESNVELLSNEILKTNNKRYIHFFIRSISNINYEVFIQKIFEFNDSKLLFYVLYDTLSLPEKLITKIIKELYILNNKEYLIKSLYYYFKILKLKDNSVLDIFKKTLIENNINVSDVTFNNCDHILERIKSEMTQKHPINESLNYSNNCYKGRKKIIPDIIVCHITSSFEKAVQMFYDGTSDVSSHFVIGEKGQFKQIINLKDSAWANGTSLNQDSDVYYKFSTNDLIKTRTENANYYTFSIEHESLDGDLTENQYKRTLEIMKEIINFIKNEYNYDFIIDRNHIIGHSEINPIVRTICPGKKFPFNKLINDLLKWRNKKIV